MTIRFGDLEKFIRYEDKDVISKIFEPNSFSFSESQYLYDLDTIFYGDREELREQCLSFGCKVDEDEVHLPANLKFDVEPITNTSDPTSMYIKRNGTELAIEFMEDADEIMCEYTDFGNKLNQYAKNNYVSLLDAYGQIKQMEILFGVTIIK